MFLSLRKLTIPIKCTKSTHTDRYLDAESHHYPSLDSIYSPYVKGTTDRIGKILNKHNIRIIFKPPKKIGQILRNPKDQRPPLCSARVYKISCSCGQVYIGEIRRMVNLRIKKHQCNVRLKHITQSALSEHNIETEH